HFSGRLVSRLAPAPRRRGRVRPPCAAAASAAAVRQCPAPSPDSGVPLSLRRCALCSAWMLSSPRVGLPGRVVCSTSAGVVGGAAPDSLSPALGVLSPHARRRASRRACAEVDFLVHERAPVSGTSTRWRNDALSIPYRAARY